MVPGPVWVPTVGDTLVTMRDLSGNLLADQLHHQFRIFDGVSMKHSQVYRALTANFLHDQFCQSVKGFLAGANPFTGLDPPIQ